MLFQVIWSCDYYSEATHISKYTIYHLWPQEDTVYSQDDEIKQKNITNTNSNT